MRELHRFDLPVPRPEDIEMNWWVFAFAAGVGLLTTLLFGLAPAVTASNVSISEALKSRGGGGSSAALARSRQILTVAEVSLAVILLCGSGLLIRSFINMTRAGLGFSTERMAVVDIYLPAVRYPDAPGRARFYDALLLRARAIPGVITAGASTTLPLKSLNVQTFRIAGRPKPVLNELPAADAALVSTEYFSLMGLPIRAGRNFTPDDALRNRRPKGEGVIIVNRAFAAKYFNGQDPLGHRLLLENDRPFEIVGISEDFLAQGAISDAHPQYFEVGIDAPKALLLLRTKIPPAAVFDAVRATLLSLDPELPVNELSSMEHIVDEDRAEARSLVVTMGIFAGLALLLAMIGVSVILAGLVASRTREIGIRIALGATPADVGLTIAGQTLRPLAIGLILGLGGSLMLSRVIESFLIGIAPTDPVTYLLAIATVAVAAPPAVWAPLRRATRIECTVALREE
jgi:putative ABC transport system permease protein